MQTVQRCGSRLVFVAIVVGAIVPSVRRGIHAKCCGGIADGYSTGIGSILDQTLDLRPENIYL